VFEEASIPNPACLGHIIGLKPMEMEAFKGRGSKSG